MFISIGSITLPCIPSWPISSVTSSKIVVVTLNLYTIKKSKMETMQCKNRITKPNGIVTSNET